MPFFEIRGLEKYYGQSHVLRGIDFSMEKGEVVSIIGSSGCGKTTLLKCINFLCDTDKGEFFLDGEKYFDAADRKNLTEDEMRENRLNFGLVFQSFNLFPQYNVLKNLTLAPILLAKKTDRDAFRRNKAQILAETEERAMALLEQVGLSGRAKKYPGQLSGGQQQRVAIARALMLSPKILCFDEPTSALDPELTGEVLRVLRDLAKKKITMIIVTHEMNFARDVSDKVVFMANGVIEESGPSAEVFGNPKSERLRSFLSNADMK